MAVTDIEQFLRERLQALDPDRSVDPGSEVDTVVVQPLLRRIGTDPFSIDVRAFMLDMLNQRFPDMPTSDLDAIAEMMILPFELFLTPITREITRLAQSQSLAIPSSLNTLEAEALGANFFEERARGEYATVRARVYYRQPQAKRFIPSTVFETTSGLGFVPTTQQSIAADQMLFNVEGTLYFFDVNLIATQPGDQYNIEPGEIVRIAGDNGYVRVTNKARARNGKAEATAEEFVEQIRTSLGEQSMVTQPGVTRALVRALPEITRIATVGAGDPRMTRDIIQGSSLGPVQFAGSSLSYLGDGEGAPTSRRASIDPLVDTDVDFTQLLGPAPIALTLYGSIAGGARRFREVAVTSVLSPTSIELEESCIPIGATNITWSIRKREVKLSRLPGGILNPDANGQGTVRADTTHVGGMFDVFLRAQSAETTSLALAALEDTDPLLEGKLAVGSNPIELQDLTLGSTFFVDDEAFSALRDAVSSRWALEVLEGPSAGLYDILAVDLAQGAPPLLSLYDAPPVPLTGQRWRLVDRINVDLLDPRKIRRSGSDLETLQGDATVTTSSLQDFQAAGVVAGDVLRLQVGQDEEEYVVQEVAAPAFSRLVLDRKVPRTGTFRYEVFKPNPSGGLTPPVLRLSTVDVLDASGRATGVTVPCAEMVGAHVLSLTNPARGVKLELPDGQLGVVTQRLAVGANVSGKSLVLRYRGTDFYSVTFAGANPISRASIASQINQTLGFAAAVDLGDRVGILPFDGEVDVVGGTVAATSALPALFGGMFYLSSRMVRSPSFDSTTFIQLSPPLAGSGDVVEVRSGHQLGAATVVTASPHPLSDTFTLPVAGLSLPTCILTDRDYFPAYNVRFALGARSVGLVRCTFLEPTTVEVDARTSFTFDQDGYSLRYRPDPVYSAQVIPPAPHGSKPKSGSVVSGSSTFSASLDFVKKRIRPGDVIEIDYKPLVGSVVLGDSIANLAGKTLVVSFGQEATRTITFIHDDDAISPSDVSRQGVADQINQALGVTAATISASLRLEVYPEFLLVIRSSGTANASLGFSAVTDQSNRSACQGRYVVRVPTNTGAEITTSFPATETRFQYRVLRPGAQRIGTTSMSAQLGEGGLYYVDFEVVSEGTGDTYNLPQGSSLLPRGYDSEGYTLSTRNPELSFSTQEDLQLTLSRTVHSLGTNDDPEEATELTGMGLSITAESLSVVAQAQDILGSDLTRDICANPLARALYPHYVHMDVRYVGGPTPESLLSSLETRIRAWPADEPFRVSWLNDFLLSVGATSVENPISLCVVVYRPDRSIRLERSQNEVNVEGLAAFYPGVLRLTRSAILSSSSASMTSAPNPGVMFAFTASMALARLPVLSTSLVCGSNFAWQAEHSSARRASRLPCPKACCGLTKCGVCSLPPQVGHCCCFMNASSCARSFDSSVQSSWYGASKASKASSDSSV